MCALDLANNPIYYEVTEPLQVIFTRKHLLLLQNLAVLLSKIELKVSTD